jgi:hypothetical protein
MTATIFLLSICILHGVEGLKLKLLLRKGAFHSLYCIKIPHLLKVFIACNKLHRRGRNACMINAAVVKYRSSANANLNSHQVDD